ncbi:Hypothetical protein A7982_03105 [Minicystis rosea]|nr:Hypothetical protein A7982_03105 [Minicystis rosea]
MRWIRASDPGLARAGHAIKTIVAVLLSFGLFRTLETPANLFAAIASGSLVQCPSGGRRRDQLAVLVGTGLAMSVLVALGSASRRFPAIDTVLVVIVAFLTFYVRRFGAALVAPTIFTFILFVVSTGFDGRAASEAGGVLGGAVIATAVHFFLLPQSPRRVLTDVLIAFTDELASLLHALAVDLRGGGAATRSVPRHLRRVTALASRAQAVADELPARDGPFVEPILRDVYEILHAAITLRRGACVAAAHAGCARSALAAVLEALARGFAGAAEGRTARSALPDIDAFERGVIASPSSERVVRAAIVVTLARRLDAIRARFAEARRRARRA